MRTDRVARRRGGACRLAQVLAGLIALVAGGAWLVGEWLARSFRVEDGRPRPSARVIAHRADAVTVTRTVRTVLPGSFRMAWDGAYALAGDVVAQDARTVTRRLMPAAVAPPPGTVVRWDAYLYRGDPGSVHGLQFQEVPVAGPLGRMPAWQLPGARQTWILIVHGQRATREEALRALPVLSALGFPVLVITYRNDTGAPSSPDGLYRLGESEWEDLDAAARHALDHGAGNLGLFGFSMGASIVETFLDRSPLADQVRFTVLDSPVLNPLAMMDAEIRRRRVPPPIGRVLKLLLRWRTGIDFVSLDHEHRDPRRAVPTLLFHGSADVVTPIAISESFAERNPATVTLARVEGAGHTAVWNAAPSHYEQVLTAFLTGPH